MTNSVASWSPNFHWPWSGNVTIEQEIAPHILSSDIRGVPEIEAEVVTDVASFGTQLGALTDAVLLLAERLDAMDEKSIQELRQIAEGVDKVKKRKRAVLRDKAVEALGRLKVADPDAHETLMKSGE